MRNDSLRDTVRRKNNFKNIDLGFYRLGGFFAFSEKTIYFLNTV